MKALAIIPARGGSKRIPRKNIKDFFGKPLIAYSIQAAIKSNLFEKVIVSTDDEEIATISKKYGAEVPFIRPKELSNDYSEIKVVREHALKYFIEQGITFQYLCTIYATAPFIQGKYLKEGLKKLQESTASNAFSVTSMPFPVLRSFKITDNNRCKMFWPKYATYRSQELTESYQDAGQFYWTDLQRPSNKFMFSGDSIPIVLPRYLVQDIDTPEDWELAEIMYYSLKKLGKIP